MILIFDSRAYEDDSPHSNLVQVQLQKLGIESIIVNPHELNRSSVILSQRGTRVSLEVQGKKIDPKLIWLSSLWRTDCIANLPRTETYPQTHRQRILQFLQDIRFTFEKRYWCPGLLHEIERAESKPYVFSMASRLGINTPSYTVDTFSNCILAQPTEGEYIYKKHLGNPFTISFQVDKRCEVGITTTNVRVGRHEIEDDDRPWQWQEPISSVAQIRCFVVSDQCWTVEWKRCPQQKYSDFRALNELGTFDFNWTPHQLPRELTRKTIDLCSQLRISSAAPEFLLTEEGEYVLIDLNPCGDWYGFFDEEIHREIASALAHLFSSLLLKSGPSE